MKRVRALLNSPSKKVATGFLVALALQFVCYCGLFLSLAVAARALSARDFGILASAVATSTLVASVITLGSDRILLSRLMRAGGVSDRLTRLRSSSLLPFYTAASVAIAATLCTSALGWTHWITVFLAIMATLGGARQIVGATFKAKGQRDMNVLATFGLQPLVIGVLFALVLLIPGGGSVAGSLAVWSAAIVLCEAVQLACLARRAKGGALTMMIRAIHWKLVKRTLGIGIVMSLWVLLAQTALFSVALGTLILNENEIGNYTMAVRLAQVLTFVYAGASQILIPLTLRNGAAEEALSGARSIRTVLVLSTMAMGLGAAFFAVAAGPILRLVFSLDVRLLDVAVVILSLGNVGLIVFGIGDQILSYRGAHAMALGIAIVAAIVLVLVAWVGNAGGQRLIGLASGTTISIWLRCYLSYRNARPRVNVPVAVFDRIADR